MKNLILSISALILFLSGCTTLKLTMIVDPVLEDNSVVYKVSYPDSLTDKISGNRLNMSFGSYQVSDADTSFTAISSKAEDPKPIFSSKKTERSGNVTTTTKISGGPTEILGFTRSVNEGEAAIKQSSRSIDYKFKIDKESTWNVNCTHNSEERVIQYKNTNSVEVLSSKYICEYKDLGDKSNNEIWVLTVNYPETITMSKKGKSSTLSAYSTDGVYLKSDGKKANLTTNYAGYTWKQTKEGNQKSISAISAREDTPRVWLNKENSKSLNNIVSMANTGLLIYSWEIQGF